jgi:hypothetical protein
MNSIAILSALTVLASGADPAPSQVSSSLVEVQATLATLAARSPAAARFTVRYENVSGDGKEAVKVRGEVGGEVEVNAAGMVIRWSQALLQQAHDEERRQAVNPESPTPTRDGLVQVQAIDLADRLDAAASLRDELARATLIEEKEDLLDGGPARLLVLKLSPRVTARDRRYLKDLEATGKLWLGLDGVPLAAEARVLGKGRIFLIITFETEIRQSWRFRRVGDRLVAVRHDDDRRWEGAGDRGERRSSSVLDLLPPPVDP